MTELEKRDLSKDEAVALTADIRETGEELFRKLHRAHEGNAWKALGYESWAAYIAAEFDFTRRNADKLVVQGRVVLELEAAAGLEARFSLPGRQAEKLAPDLRKHVKAIKAAVSDLPPDATPEERAEVLRETLDRRAEDPRVQPRRAPGPGYQSSDEAVEPPMAPVAVTTTPTPGQPARWRELLGDALAARVAAISPTDPAAWCVKVVKAAVVQSEHAAKEQAPKRRGPACPHPDQRRSVNGRCKDCGDVVGVVFRSAKG